MIVDRVEVGVDQGLDDQDGRLLDGRRAVDVRREERGLAGAVAELLDLLTGRGRVGPGAVGLRHGEIVNVVNQRQQ